MLEPSAHWGEEQLANLQAQLVTLKQENIELQLRLQACERSQANQSEINGSTLEHRLLEATATAANALLTIANFNTAVKRALQIVGEALETDRINVIKNLDPPSDSAFPWWRVLYEWDSPGTVPQHTDPEAAQGSYEEIPEVYEQLSRGQALSYLIEEAPEPFRSAQIAIGVKSTHLVPISVKGEWWGVLGLDDCREAKHRSVAELSVLKIAADCIGSAIERDRTQQALLQAEQTRSQELEHLNAELVQAIDRLQTRDRLLEVTAMAANTLLTFNDFDEAINTTLKILGEALQTDRVKVLEHFFEDQSSAFPTASAVVYEWVTPGTVSQMAHPTSSRIDARDADRVFMNQVLHKGFGGLLHEWDRTLWDAFETVQAKAIYCVPIWVQDQVWGSFIFDDCHEVKQRSPIEMSILKIGANCIGSAIERDRTQQALLQAEQARSQELERINAQLQQTLDRLSESEEQFRTLFELSTQGFYYTEVHPPCPVTLPIEEQCDWLYRNIRVMKANPAMAAMYGVNHPDELIGLRNADVHIANSEKNTAFIRGMIENGYRGQNLETEEIDSQGRLHYFLNSGVITIKDGYAVGAWGSQIDITELRQAQQALLRAEQERSQELEHLNTQLQQTIDRLTESEQRYRQLMGLASEGIFRVKYEQPISMDLSLEEQAQQVYQQFRIVEHNLAYAKMYGYDQPDAMMNARLIDLHVVDAPENAVQMEQFVRNGHQMRNQETVEFDRLGRKRHFLNNGFSIIQDGYAIGGWGTQVDITELREAQQALLEAEQARVAELEKANEELQHREQEVQQSYRLLSVVAEVTQDLLENSQVEAAIDQAFQQVGEAAGISRIALMQERLEASSGRLQHHVIQEWVASGVPRQMDDPATKAMYSDEYGVLVDELYAGHSIWHILEDLPEPVQSQQAEIEVKSTGAVPIFIEGEYFGCVGFDDCVDYRQWTDQEIDVLTSAAGGIGAALHRKQLVDRIVEERTQAEQARAAELVQANNALRRSIDALTNQPSVEAFLEVTLRSIAEVLEVPSATLWKIEESWATLQLVYQDGQVLPGHQTDHSNANTPGQLWDAYDAAGRISDSPFCHPVDEPTSQFTEAQQAMFRRLGVRSVLVAPIVIGDRTVSIITARLTHEMPDPSPLRLELVNALTGQAALALQMSQLAEEAKQAAILDERNRLARDIHDSLAQSFTGIIMQLEAVKSAAPSERTPAKANEPCDLQIRLDRISDLARLGLSEARRSVQALRPQVLEVANFADALHYLLHQMSHDTPLRATVHVEGTPYTLPATIEENLLRIAQEALTNAIRHGHAHTLTLQLLFEPAAIHLQISDDGDGFDPQNIAAPGFGLVGMQERILHLNGDFHLTSYPGQGTKITVTIPVNA